MALNYPTWSEKREVGVFLQTSKFLNKSIIILIIISILHPISTSFTAD